jgi:ribokinase
MSEPKFLVVGSVNTDLVVRTRAMPAPGQTVLGEELTTSPGGKGANQAVALARLGADVAFLGRVGDDAFGLDLRRALDAEHVCTENLLTCENSHSGVAMITVDSRGENSIVVAPGANARLTPDDLYGCQDSFAADVVLLQLELPIPTVRTAIELARQHGCMTILDPAPVPTPFDDKLCEVDILAPNASEAEQITGQKSGEERVDKLIASNLIARGCGRAVLKLGSRGSLVVCADGHMYRIPPFDVNVVDSTAAGDAFQAGLAYQLAHGESPRQAATFANAVGALACTRLGAFSAMPTLLEVQMLLRDQPR